MTNSKKYMNEQAILAAELHKPARKKFQTRRVITLNIDDLWQADLADMQNLASKNKNMKYILTIIDTFSKVAYAVPLKKKTAAEVAEAFENVFKRHGSAPKNIQTDLGLEFFNSTFKELMKKYNINHYNTYSDKKASIVERFNRTLKTKMWKYFTEHNTEKWIDILEDLVQEYNNTRHNTIGMKPNEVNKSNKLYVLERIQTSKMSIAKPKFNVGDTVRISRKKQIFEKGYKPNWSEELFIITSAKNTVPRVYTIKDLAGQPIKGTFYKQELQKTKIPDYARIEKVLQKKVVDGQEWLRVKWTGYDNRFNSWIGASDAVSL
jgi:hypothetical protein